MKDITIYLGIQIAAFAFIFALVPLLRFAALKVKLQDNPNARKVHKRPIPLIGGLAIVLSAGCSLVIFQEAWQNAFEFYVLLVGSTVLLIMGVIDDKVDLNSILKLVVQLVMAYLAVNSGIKIESLFGIFGIYEIPEMAQNVLSLVIIVGVVNAFNLMDGIDGLAAGVAILGLTAYSIIAIFTGQHFLLALFAALIGALFGFLRFNLSHTRKIFMGDAGSLVFGYILVVAGIMLIQAAHNTSNITMTLSIVIGVLSFPVADSLRVYRRRIKNGYSPFMPDKTHFHHMVLSMGFKHKMASLMIILIALGLVVVSLIFGSLFSMTFTIISILLLFAFVSSMADISNQIDVWKDNIKKLEDLKNEELTPHSKHHAHS